MVVVVGVRRRNPAFRQAELQRPDRQTVPFFEIGLADARRQDGGGIGQHPRLEVGKGVEQRGDEHVAGDSADGIEMDQRHVAAERCTGMT